jgi:crotonobetainyl-CoA:carnitine CoA-transferase CaiB-like acyl-CoA transferase
MADEEKKGGSNIGWWIAGAVLVVGTGGTVAYVLVSSANERAKEREEATKAQADSALARAKAEAEAELAGARAAADKAAQEADAARQRQAAEAQRVEEVRQEEERRRAAEASAAQANASNPFNQLVGFGKGILEHAGEIKDIWGGISSLFH